MWYGKSECEVDKGVSVNKIVQCNCPCKRPVFPEGNDLKKIINQCDSGENMIKVAIDNTGRVRKLITKIDGTEWEKEYLAPLLVILHKRKSNTDPFSAEDESLLYHAESKVDKKSVDTIIDLVSKAISLLSKIQSPAGTKLEAANNLLKEVVAGGVVSGSRNAEPTLRDPTQEELNVINRLNNLSGCLQRLNNPVWNNAKSKHGRCKIERAGASESLLELAKKQKEERQRHLIDLSLEKNSEDKLLESSLKVKAAQQKLKEVSDTVLTDNFLNREEAWQEKVAARQDWQEKVVASHENEMKDEVHIDQEPTVEIDWEEFFKKNLTEQHKLLDELENSKKKHKVSTIVDKIRDNSSRTDIQPNAATNFLKQEAILDMANSLVKKHIAQEEGSALESLQTLRQNLLTKLASVTNEEDKQPHEQLLHEVVKKIREEGQKEFHKDCAKRKLQEEKLNKGGSMYPLVTLLRTKLGNVEASIDPAGIKIFTPKHIKIDIISNG